MRGRILVWAAAVVAAGGITGLSVFLAVTGLTEASEAASVAVAVVELLALIIGVYGVIRERRITADAQSITGTTVGGSSSQTRAVKGNVRIRRSAVGLQAATPLNASVGGGTVEGDGQSVTGSHVAGRLDQITDVGGDVEIGDL